MVPKRLTAGERRASILAVAKVLFADKGYHGVSVDEIARRVGVSPAVLYRHFASKEALYEAVLNGIACQRESYIEAALKGPEDFGSVLARMALVFTAGIEQDPDYLRMELQSALQGHDLTLRYFFNRWKSISDFIEFNLAELAPQRRVAQIDPQYASLMYQGMLREVLYAKCILNSERYKAHRLGELVAEMTALFLRAIAYQPTGNDKLDKREVG